MIKFITSSKDKFEEARKILPDLEQLSIDLDEIQELDPKKVIEHKMRQAFRHDSGPFIIDDSGFCLEALNGFPGPLAKWFWKALTNEGIYGLISKAGLSDKVKIFCTLGYAKSPEQIDYIESTIEAKVVAPRGTHGFGFDPIMVPNGQNLTFAEMSIEEKTAISHRGRAFRKLKDILDVPKN